MVSQHSVPTSLGLPQVARCTSPFRHNMAQIALATPTCKRVVCGVVLLYQNHNCYLGGRTCTAPTALSPSNTKCACSAHSGTVVKTGADSHAQVQGLLISPLATAKGRISTEATGSRGSLSTAAHLHDCGFGS